jgi:putative ABC transport system permease protein
MCPLDERVFALLMRAYPRRFRQRYGHDLLEFFRAERAHPRFGRAPLRQLRFWSATTRDLLRTAASERLPVSALRTPNRATLMRIFADILFDCRDAFRSLRATPAVTITALLVLTLGIGISTAIFSVVDGIVLRDLPFEDPEELMAITETELPSGRRSPAAYANFADWARTQDVFDSLAASANGPTMTTADAERPERLRSYRISANLLDVLRVDPVIGAGITANDIDSRNKVALISDALWRRRFNADPAAVGKTIVFDGGAYTVAGVMPPGFTYPIGSALASRIDLWVPFVPTSHEAVRGGARNYNVLVIGRIKPGVSGKQAVARMLTIRNTLAAATPAWFVDRGVEVLPLKDVVVPKQIRSWMLMLLAAVAAVLLVACANVANLLLVRASNRGRELGVRAAMGATRWRLVRGLVVESVILASIGTTGGVLLAYWGVDLLRVTLPANLPRVWAIAVDVRVIAIAGAVAIATGILCGMVPALQMSRADVSAALRASSRASTPGRSRQRARAAFLVVEVALAAVLLIGAGIFTASFVRLVRTDLGFGSEHRLSVSVQPVLSPQERQVPGALLRAQSGLFDALSRVQSIPGVESAAIVAGGAPLSSTYAREDVWVGEQAFNQEDAVTLKQVTSGYLNTIGATLLAGRWIDPSDRRGAPPVIVLSDEAVRRYFRQQEPIGAQIRMEGEAPRTVVGVVRGMRLLGPETEVTPEAYVPLEQARDVSAAGSLVLRAAGDPGPLIPAVKAAIWSAVPNAVIPEPTTFDEMFAGIVAQRKLNMVLLTLFGGLALLIAAIGIYGVMAFLVNRGQRRLGSGWRSAPGRRASSQ